MTVIMSRDAAAYHEAGHAVIAWAMGCTVHFARLKAEGGGEYGCGDPVEEEGKFILCLAGPASQRKHGPTESWHGGGDYGKAAEIALRFGVTDERASKLIEKARELVAEQWHHIEGVAAALIECGKLDTAEIEALLGPTPDRVKLTKEQCRNISAWAEQARLVEAVRLFGSRAKGFARSDSDVDLAITASDGNYTRFDVDWKEGLSAAVGNGLEVRVSQYRGTGPVHDYCDRCSVLLFERPHDCGIKRPKSNHSAPFQTGS
jgi:predicted nucleotidyltransferase